MLQSVHHQTYRHIEHLLIDGGSTDQTLALLSAHGNHLAQLVSAPDRGIYDALNKGLALATGDWIGILHTDDLLESPDTLQLVAQELTRTNADLLYADLAYVQATNPNAVVRMWHSGAYSDAALRWGWMPPHPTVFVRRNFAARVGGYDLSYRIAADYEYLLRCFALRPTVAYLPQVTVRMRVGGTSNRSLGNILRKSNEDLRAMQHHKMGAWSCLLGKNLRKLPQLWAKSSLGQHFTTEL